MGLERSRNKEMEVVAENSAFQTRLVDLEKEQAMLQLELKGMRSRLVDEERTHTEDIASLRQERSVIINKEEANIEQVKILQTKLNEEKLIRQKAESTSQE